MVYAQVLKISLNFNPIGDKLSVSALAGLELHLRELQMGACAIKSLPDGLLAGMDRLLSLHLWANRIRHIPTSFFRAAPQLRELVLWGNSISRVDGDTFAGLWKLRKLDLDRNRISSLDKEAFRHLSELAVLFIHQVIVVVAIIMIIVILQRAISQSAVQVQEASLSYWSIRLFFSERIVNVWNNLPGSVDFSSNFVRAVKLADLSDYLRCFQK